MRAGEIVFTAMERVVFGRPAAEAVAESAERLGARRVFLLAGSTLNRRTDAVRQIAQALGPRYAGVHDEMPAHSPRDAVIACANKAREAGCDLLVSVGGGSTTDGGKAVTLCLEHDIREPDGLEPFRTVVDEITGKRHFPHYRAPRVRQICVPTTLSGGEFNARAGVTEPRLRLKQAYIHPGLIPLVVIFDPAITVHTPEWLWLSTGIRAVDHAVETFCSIDGNAYTDSTALQALRLLGRGLPAVKRDPADLAARLDCQIGAWNSMAAIVTGTRMGASHAIGHVLGGSAGVPHGYTSCVMLPAVLAFNSVVNADRQAEISAALGAAGQPASDVLDRFIADLGLPRRLRDVGVKREDLPRIATNCMLDDWTFSNPRPIRGAQEIVPILESVY
ncbi:iron-containing alcohol dehydrogenase [Reyranella sp.]|uniref:iron-containing alcohol dehydrogenase n=1 Tax=Reyranella sp. TaxID=1929291 RepID=UPI00272F150E|nr:iron-containing alcohol dehydrogenase [Reyranella sp.]MDP2376795.1 iron-containing alcohol dehydrogenase [Reyranella sp.]